MKKHLRSVLIGLIASILLIASPQLLRAQIYPAPVSGETPTATP